MRWRFLVSFDEMTLLSSSLMNRFRQVWWVVSSQTSLDKSRTDIHHLIIENEHASFVKTRLNDQKNDDEMIKHDHENESSQIISAKTNLNRISQITFHTLKQNAKHVISILSQQLVSIFTASKFLLKELTNLHLSQQWFVYRISSSRAKRERLLRAKKFIIVMFSKKSNSKTKRLFSFIITCYSKSLNTI
jgi:regulator of replication initiation timing